MTVVAPGGRRRAGRGRRAARAGDGAAGVSNMRAEMVTVSWSAPLNGPVDCDAELPPEPATGARGGARRRRRVERHVVDDDEPLQRGEPPEVVHHLRVRCP